MTSRLLSWILLSTLITSSVSFSLSAPCSLPRVTSRNSPLFLAVAEDEDENKCNEKSKNKKDDLSGIPREERTDGGDYQGSVDWDAEWKKVVKNQGQPTERPGKDFYKSEAEIAAIRAMNRAQEQAQKASSNMPSMPSWDSLKGDWKVRCARSLELEGEQLVLNFYLLTCYRSFGLELLRLSVLVHLCCQQCRHRRP